MKRIDPELLVMFVCVLGFIVCALDLFVWRP